MYPVIAGDPAHGLVLAYRTLPPACSRVQVRVQRWLDGTWEQLQPVFTASEPRSSSHPSLALDGAGQPYLALEEDNGRTVRVNVKTWDGAAWRALGDSLNISEVQNAFEPSIAWRGQNLVVAWREYDLDTQSNNVYVKRWNGSKWVDFGGPLDVDVEQGAYAPSLALDSDGYPVVAWREHGVADTVRVKRWDGSVWRELGIADRQPSRAAETPSLQVDSEDRPVVAWQEHDGTSTNIYASRWENGAWRRLGGALDMRVERATDHPSLTVDRRDRPVVAWREQSDSGQALVFVKRWNGHEWQTLGSPLNASPTGGGYSPSISAGEREALVVAWHEYDGANYRIQVKRWDGYAWRALDYSHLSRWHPHYRERCYFHSDSLSTPVVAELEALVAFVSRDPELGAPLVQVARSLGVPICIDERYDGTYGSYNWEHGAILLSNRLSFHEQAVILVHELRHLDTASRGFRPLLRYDLSEVTRLVLAVEADAQAVNTLYAWRLRESGEPGGWEALGGFEHDPDIAEAFEREMHASGSELLATRAAFRQWFASEWRTGNYSLHAGMNYLDLLDSTKAIPYGERLPEGFFDELCHLPSGESYDCGALLQALPTIR